MCSTTKDQKMSVMRRTRRRGGRRIKPRSRGCVARRSCNNGGGTCSKVADKLEALKNLIPTHEEETVKPEQLFQQTADYIVLLRTQVVILQKLVDFYGSGEAENTKKKERVTMQKAINKEKGCNSEIDRSKWLLGYYFTTVLWLSLALVVEEELFTI
ncbi:hypothetical protein G4B88_029396 [Cannabis sativa]|uniref:Uncharacterized protein n=1 Tax=Cannabis sativa TaxID=3483 RepID=A0A7J6FZU0_CANSA|nr:hypothetical protein G4B88_029396 [Cannabis sativa]